MAAPTSLNHKTFFGNLINLFTFEIPKNDVHELMNQTVDLVLAVSKGRIVSKRLPNEKELLIEQVYKTYTQTPSPSIEELLTCDLFKELTTIEDNPEIKANLDYLEAVSVSLRLKAVSKNWNPKAETLKTNQAFTKFLAQLFSGLGDPKLIADQVELYKTLPQEVSQQFFDQRTELSDHLAEQVGKGEIRRKDLQFLIELIQSDSPNSLTKTTSQYLNFLASLNLQNQEIFKTMIQKFFTKLKEINSCYIPFDESNLINEDWKSFVSLIENTHLDSKLLSNCHEINCLVINLLNTSALTQPDLQTLLDYINFEKNSIIDFTLRYLSLLYIQPDYKEDLKKDILRGLKKFKESPQVKD